MERRVAWAFALGVIVFCAGVREAESTVYTFEAFGEVAAPIYWTKRGKQVNSGHFISMDVTAGSLFLTYDSATGISRIQGVTPGCVVNCTKPINGSKTSNGTYIGSGDFEWDLTFRNPLGAFTSGDGERFGYGMQDVGGITLLDAPKGVPAFTPVTAKNDKDFAFRVFPDGNGDFTSESWLFLMGGIVGGFSRVETGNNNSQVNWNLTLVRRDQPPTEIPEPASAGLLLTGLAVGALRRRRAKLLAD